MKLNAPIDRPRISSHFQYSVWKYLLLIVAAIFVWDLIYAYTAYRSPQDKRIDIYTQHAVASQEYLNAYFDELRKESVPDMEVVNAVTLMGTSAADMYAAQQLTTYIMAGEGDLYFLSGDDFKRFAAQGAFVELEPYAADGTLVLDGLMLDAGKVAMQEYDSDKEVMVPIAQQRLYGIPASQLPGFPAILGIDNRDLFLAATTFSGNEENVMRFLNALIQQMRADSLSDSESPLFAEETRP